MTDALGPGTHVLFQDFVVPTALKPTDSMIQFDLFIGNRATFFAAPNPPSLDFSLNAFNQQVRVDLMKGGTNAFSVAPADVVQNLYQSNPGDALVTGYRTIDVGVRSALLANLGQTLRLRFSEVDNVNNLQMGVDDVSFQAIPEPSQLLTAGLGLSLMLGCKVLSLRRSRAV
jgi:hypothetical protein